MSKKEPPLGPPQPRDYATMHDKLATLFAADGSDRRTALGPDDMHGALGFIAHNGVIVPDSASTPEQTTTPEMRVVHRQIPSVARQFTGESTLLPPGVHAERTRLPGGTIWSWSYYVLTRAGRIAVERGDWIVTDNYGSVSVCSDASFALKYEPAPE